MMRLVFLIAFTNASHSSWSFGNGDLTTVTETSNGQLKKPLVYIRFVSPAAAAIITNQTSGDLDPASLNPFEIDTVGEESKLILHGSYHPRQYLIQPDRRLICAIPASSDLDDEDAINQIITLPFTTERSWSPSPGLTTKGAIKIGYDFGSNFVMVPTNDDHPIIYLNPENLEGNCSSPPGFVGLTNNERGMLVQLSARINGDNDFVNDGSHSFDSFSINSYIRIASSVDYLPHELFTRIVRDVHNNHAGTYRDAIRSRDFLRGGTRFRNCNMDLFPTIVYSIKSTEDDNAGPTNLVLYPEDYVGMENGGNCIARILPVHSRQYNPFGPRGTIGLNVFKNVVGIFEPGYRVGFCEPRE